MISNKDQARLDFLVKESGIPLWFFYLILGVAPTVGVAKTWQEAKTEFTASLPGSGEQIMAAYRLSELASSLEEAKITTTLVGHLNEKIRWFSLRRWNQLAYTAIDTLCDQQSLIAELHHLPRQSVAYEYALKKILTHALTDTEFATVHTAVVYNLSSQQELLEKWLALTTNPISLQKIYHYSLHGSEIEGSAWEKWNMIGRSILAKTDVLQEIRVLWRHLPTGGTAMEYGALRALEIAPL